MKKIIALLLAVMMMLALAACGEKAEPVETPAEAPVEEAPVEEPAPTELPEIDKLADAALEENELKVICSCSEDIMKSAAAELEAIYGITVSCEYMSAEDAAAAIEAGTDADVWMGAPSAFLKDAAGKGLFTAYEAENAVNLLSEEFRAADGSWYGIYADLMGFVYNLEKIDKDPDMIPAHWEDLYGEKYYDKICASLRDSNGVAAVESGVYDIAIGEVSYGVTRALKGSNIDFAVPEGELRCTLTGTAIISGCAHENAAKQWVEFILSDFAEPADLIHWGLFPVIAGAPVHAVAAALNLDIAEARVIDLTGSEDLPTMVDMLK